MPKAAKSKPAAWWFDSRAASDELKWSIAEPKKSAKATDELRLIVAATSPDARANVAKSAGCPTGLYRRGANASKESRQGDWPDSLNNWQTRFDNLHSACDEWKTRYANCGQRINA